MKIHFIVGVLILLLATCSVKPTPANSGVEGQVFIGPNCPIVQQGQSCPDQPYQATLTINSLEGKKITQAQTDGSGRFQIALAPGQYMMHPESQNVMPFAAEQTFTVEAGMFTQVIVNYDSGIR